MVQFDEGQQYQHSCIRDNGSHQKQRLWQSYPRVPIFSEKFYLELFPWVIFLLSKEFNMKHMYLKIPNFASAFFPTGDYKYVITLYVGGQEGHLITITIFLSWMSPNKDTFGWICKAFSVRKQTDVQTDGRCVLVSVCIYVCMYMSVCVVCVCLFVCAKVCAWIWCMCMYGVYWCIDVLM